MMLTRTWLLLLNVDTESLNFVYCQLRWQGVCQHGQYTNDNVNFCVSGNSVDCLCWWLNSVVVSCLLLSNGVKKARNAERISSYTGGFMCIMCIQIVLQ